MTKIQCCLQLDNFALWVIRSKFIGSQYRFFGIYGGLVNFRNFWTNLKRKIHSSLGGTLLNSRKMMKKNPQVFEYNCFSLFCKLFDASIFRSIFSTKNFVFIFSKNHKKLSHSQIQERLIVVMPEANESVRRFLCGILELDYLI